MHKLRQLIVEYYLHWTATHEPHLFSDSSDISHSSIIIIVIFLPQKFSADVVKKCGEDGSNIVGMSSTVCVQDCYN
jgi:hypothetical protein